MVKGLGFRLWGPQGFQVEAPRGTGPNAVTRSIGKGVSGASWLSVNSKQFSFIAQ